MNDVHRIADVEGLARLAARLAGCDPDKHVRLQLGPVLAFDDLTWRYPDFLARADAAYQVLNSAQLLPA